jgi:hypothetical protein
MYEKYVWVIAGGNKEGKWELRDVILNKKCLLM